MLGVGIGCFTKNPWTGYGLAEPGRRQTMLSLRPSVLGLYSLSRTEIHRHGNQRRREISVPKSRAAAFFSMVLGLVLIAVALLLVYR